MVKFKTWLYEYLSQRTGWTIRRQEMASLLGTSYRVFIGTIHTKADYDDAWLFALAQEARIVFDIGSNIGQSSVLFLHSGHVSQVVLVEPNPTSLSRAAENIILNGWSDKARFVCAFAADKPNEVKRFFSIGTGAADSMYASLAKTASASATNSMVSTTSVDCMVEKYQIVPDLVKIDVEGAEILVLRGATALAKKRVTRFFVEMHSCVELTMMENARQVLDWCEQNNYWAWYLKEKSHVIDAKQISTRGRCHLLLQPDKAHFPAALLSLKESDSLDKVCVR